MKQLNLLFWFFWIVTYVLVYSYLGGIMHFYYLSTLAPALAALAGIGIAGFFSDEYQHQRGTYILLLITALLGTAVWQVYIQASVFGLTPGNLMSQPAAWLNWLHRALIGGTMLSAAILIVLFFLPFANRAIRMLNRGSLVLGIITLLAVPMAWTLSTVLLPEQGLLPSADLYRAVAASRRADAHAQAPRQSADTTLLSSFLLANRNGERYVAATSTTQLAAPIIISTGQAVLARGGFHGLDPAVTVETLARMVETGQVRFIMLGDLSIAGRRMGARTAGKEVARWVRENGTRVDPALWKGARMNDSVRLYDLRPEIGLVPVPLTREQ